MMAQPRLGHVDARPATRPRTPAEVEVLPLHEERLVEAAELEQHAAPDEHRCAVRAHGWHDAVRRRVVLEMEAGYVLVPQAPPREPRARVDHAAVVLAELRGVGREASLVRVERLAEVRE